MQQQRQMKLQDALAVSAAGGDAWAMAELNSVYGNYIGGVCAKIIRGTVSQEMGDLKQFGFIVLAEMVNEYDAEKAAFTTHLMNYFPHKLKRELDKIDRPVYVPVNVLQNDRRTLRETGTSEFPLNAVTSVSDKTITGSDGETLSEADYLALVAPDMVQPDNAEENLLAKEVLAQVDSLPTQDQILIRMYYMQGLTLEQIGEALGRTRQAVNVAIAKALGRLQYRLGVTQNEPTHNTRMHHVRSIKQASRH